MINITRQKVSKGPSANVITTDISKSNSPVSMQYAIALFNAAARQAGKNADGRGGGIPPPRACVTSTYSRQNFS